MNLHRWALLAGITGTLANLLLIALFTVPSADWTGPANDLLGGVVSNALTVPVVLAWRRDLPALSWAAVAGLTTIAVLSVLLVADMISFEAQFAGIALPVMALFGWVWAAGRSGRRLTPGLSRVACWVGAGATLGYPLLLAAALLPEGSAGRLLLGAVAVLLVTPAWLTFPIWLIRLGLTLRPAPHPVPA
jgi:hypothetical protein